VRGQFTGTWRLLAGALRRDRLRLAIWVAAIPGLFYAGLASESELFSDQAELAARAAVMNSSTGVAFGGPRYGLDSYDLGGIVMNEYSSTIMVCLAIMAIGLVVHASRAEEESGRAELVGAAVTGRWALLTAAALESLAACLAIGLLCAGAMTANGLAPADSLAAAAGFALVGCVFAALGLLTSQLASSARGASGAALGIMGALYLVRVAGDIPAVGGTALSWLSPFAWAQQTRAFYDLRWWPLVLALAAAVALTALALWCARRRDLGAGLVPERRARPDAPAWLRSPLALGARLARPSWTGWTASAIILGATCGPITGSVDTMLADNREWAQLLGFDESALTAAFLSMMVLYCALLGVCFAVANVARAHSAEAAGLTELVLAQPVARWRYLGSYAAVSAIGGAATCLLGTLALGLTAQAAGVGDWFELLRAGLAYLPVVALFTGLALVIYAIAPRAGAASWALVAYGVVATMFGQALSLPGWAVKAGVFGAVGLVPQASYRAAPLTIMALAALAFGLAAFKRFRARDIPA
jgi:ABC-2 type transport system permease protein